MKDVKEITAWYTKQRPLFEALATKVKIIIEENLVQNQIEFHSITYRAKDIQSYVEKAKKEKYKEPNREITDMAGIRVITYLESDVDIVSEYIEKLFTIIPEASINKSKLLGNDKVGYRSNHFLCTFDPERCKLPENHKYKDLFFEIQIRSILQHAWAEIEHDRNYKFSGKLPSQLERRFYLVAGMLEVADNEFSSIAKEIEQYRQNVLAEVHKGDMDIEINSTSIKEYFANKFPNLIKIGVLTNNFGGDEGLGKVIVEELGLFGLSTLKDIDNIIPIDLEDNMLSIADPWNNLSGLIRDILIIEDASKYFGDCWRNSWAITDRVSLALYRMYKVNLRLVEEYVEFSQ